MKLLRVREAAKPNDSKILGKYPQKAKTIIYQLLNTFVDGWFRMQGQPELSTKPLESLTNQLTKNLQKNLTLDVTCWQQLALIEKKLGKMKTAIIRLKKEF